MQGGQHVGAHQLMLPDPKSLRILVIDSKAASRQTTTQLLRECAYQVTAVKTAREGLQLLIEADHGAGFDLVLKEHEPPGANACRLLKRMAKTEELSKTPVVVTSNNADRETVMSCLSLGAIDYLIKPLRLNELRHIWTRVWWWRKSQGQVAGGPAAHAPRHYSFRGPNSGNRQYEATSSDSKQTKCQDEEEPTSKEGSAPDNGNGHGSKGNGSNGSKEGNGTSRVDDKPHCDIKDTGHGSNGNGHGSNNGNGHGSNGNGSNGSSDNKNGGNGNSATKGDGNGHGSNGNGASTTLAVDRHYQALVNTAEGKMPANLVAGHDGVPGPTMGGTMGRSSAFAQYTGPSTSSRKRAATSEAAQPGGSRERKPAPAPEDDNGTGGSGMPGAGGAGTGGGGSAAGGVGSGTPGARSKAAAPRDRDRATAAALRCSGGSGHTHTHTVSDNTFQPNADRVSPAGGSGAAAGATGGGGLLSGSTPNHVGSSYHNHAHNHSKQPTPSSDRPGSQGISPSRYASLQTHTPSGSNGGGTGGNGSRSGTLPQTQQQQQQQQQLQQQQQQTGSAVAAAWLAGIAAHHHAPHPLVGLPPAATAPGLPGGFPGMFAPAPFGMPPGHMLSRIAHPALRFGPAAPASSGSHGGNPGAGGAPLDAPQLQSMFPFPPTDPMVALAAAATEAHQAARAAAAQGSAHPHAPPHSLILGALGAQPQPEGAAGTKPAVSAPGLSLPVAAPAPLPSGPATSGATNLNAMILNQLLAGGVPLQAFLGQPPLGHHIAPPGSRALPHPHPGVPGALPLHPHAHAHHQQQQQQAAAAAAAVAAATAAWRAPPFAPASIHAAAAAAAGVLGPFPAPLPPGHVLPPGAGSGMPGGGMGGMSGMAAREAQDADGHARFGRGAAPGVPEPNRRRALALDKYRKKRKNLRFSKTIRYEARKQLAQQRPRVRGQFIKHDGGGGGGGMDDGGPTVSNGAKSGTGGAGGVAGDDGGGEEEVQTNSRGYYEEDDYDPEDEETEAEPDDMQIQPESQRLERMQSGEAAEGMDLDSPETADAAAVGGSGSGGSGSGGAGTAFDGQPTSAAAIANGNTGGGGTAHAVHAAAAAVMRASCGLPRCGGGGGADDEEAAAAAVVRSLMGLRDAAMLARTRPPVSDLDVAPLIRKEARSSRSVGSQGSSHGHSHSQQQQHSQGQSHGVPPPHGAYSHGHSRPMGLHRQAQGPSSDGAAAAQLGQQHLAPGQRQPTPPVQHARAYGQQPQAAQPHASALLQGQVDAAAQAQAGPSQQQHQQLCGAQTAGVCAPSASLPRASHGLGSDQQHHHLQQQPSQQHMQQGVAAGQGAATGSGRGSGGLHGVERDPRDGRDHRERDLHRDSGRERDPRDREGGVMGDNGGANGKNGSDSGSNSPDENAAGAGGGGGGSAGGARAKGAAEKGGHGAHKSGGGHGHGHR